MKTRIFRIALLGGGPLWLLAPFGAPMAQSAAPSDGSATLQEIIVTAQRSETNLQRTPIAVTAVSGEELATRSASTFLDLQTFTPGLQTGSRTNQGLAQGSFSIRGIGVDAVASAPSVGIYVDDVYYPSGAGNLLGFFDVERVEVLRGPQGTLFGRNTIAGAIQYITVKPGKTLTGFAEATGGNFGRGDFSGALTVPLGETLSARVSLQTTNRDGFVHDDLNNIDRGDDEVEQGRIQVRWTPSDRLTIDLKADELRQSNNGRALAVTAVTTNALFYRLSTNPALGPFAYTGPFDDRFVNVPEYHIAGFNSEEFFKFKYQSAQGTVQYALTDNITLKSITAGSRTDQYSSVDFDSTPASLLRARGAFPMVIDLFTQELQLSGSSFGDLLKWTAGLYYYDAEEDDNGRGFALGMLPDSGFVLANGHTIIKNNAKAVYGQGTYSFNEKVSLTIGLRYSEEDVDGSNLTFPVPPLSETFTDTSPLVSLNYQVNPDAMLYAKASKGFRSGGFAVSAALASGFVVFGPETAWTYEAGARMEFLDRRLRVNPTVYFTEWKDIQFSAPVLGVLPNGTPTTVVSTANAGDAEIMGAELETQYAATDRLVFTGSAATIDGEYTRIAPGVDLTLNSELQRTPRFKYAVGGRYTYALASEAKLLGSLDWSHTASQRSATTDSGSRTLPAYNLLNARLQYTEPSGKWSIAVFGTNLTDEYYLIGGTGTFASTTTGVSVIDLARPREYGVTLRAEF